MADPELLPTPASAQAPQVSGRRVVQVFVVFVIVGALVSVLLAQSLRPATMEAQAKMRPLSGRANVQCLEPGQPPTDVRQRGICSTAASLELSVQNPGAGIKSMSYVLLSRSPSEPPVTGQFALADKARISLAGAVPEYHVAVSIFAEVPLSLEGLTAAVKAIPVGDVPKQIEAIEQYCSSVMHADPKNPIEIRTDRVEMKIVK